MAEDTSKTSTSAFQRVEDQIAQIGQKQEPSQDGETVEEDIQVVDEIESLCMSCEENGTTRLLLTKIPFFREIILMSFECPHCHTKNTEIQSAGEIQKRGSKVTFRIENVDDLQRQIVKSDNAVFSIVDLDLEMPPGKGRLTNIEGLVSGILQDLELSQDQRREIDLTTYEKLEVVIQGLKDMLAGSRFPFSASLDDPTGNSTLEPSPSDSANKLVRTSYARTAEQNEALGLANGEAESGATVEGGMEDVDILEGEVYRLPCFCPGCTKEAAMNVQMVHIPYFKQVIITAVVCDHCGYKTNDVKTGGDIPDKGQRITLRVEGPQDLRRDILKSESCRLIVPECQLEVEPGTMGGRFTTVEGLIQQVRDDLHGSIYDMDDKIDKGGDSMPDEKKRSWGDFFAGIDRAIAAEVKFTVILEDPLSNSYVQSMTAPEPDPQIDVLNYVRTAMEEEELGLLDMKTRMGANGEYENEYQGQDKQVDKKDGEEKMSP
ncbi:nucleolar zinc-finger protein [Agyrium rufum]|nr:nucleolar zinc-finger protein [Agyrium rufum]